MSIFDFSDPIITKKREQPYPQIIEEIVVVNNKMLLRENPDKFNKVQIKDKSNQTQIYYEIDQNIITSEFTYFVDYLNGIVTVDSSQNNKTFICTYYGVSTQYIPHSRIYTQTNELGDDIVQTLEQVVENANAYLSIADQLVTKGEYNSETIYSKRNMVFNSDKNAVYMYINDVPEFGKLLTDTNYWQEIIDIADIVNLLNTTNTTVNNAETVRQNQESTRQQQEQTRVTAEAARVAGGALIKSGDTMPGTLNMNGILNMNNNIVMNGTSIQLGGFKIKHNPNLNSIDFEF
jgi:hypothetical protein